MKRTLARLLRRAAARIDGPQEIVLAPVVFDRSKVGEITARVRRRRPPRD
jgi:hypothetical protein